jgi:sulfur carrier protein
VRIAVKLFATLRKGRFDVAEMEAEAGTTVGSIVDEVGLPRRDVTLIFVNGRHAGFHDVVKEGDTVALFPPVGGG